MGDRLSYLDGNLSERFWSRVQPLENVYMRKDGGRQCKACTRMHIAAFKARQRAAAEVAS